MQKNKTEVRVSGGVSMGGLLQVALIVLKLCGVIDWSWWWILTPAWGACALIVFTAILAIILEVME